jgi:membrane protease YdiL (CAAX protease family)
VEILWRLAYCAALSVLVWLLHSRVGSYPAALARSDQPRRDFYMALSLWGVGVIVPIGMIFLVEPLFERLSFSQATASLATAVIRTAPYLLLPLFLVIRPHRWRRSDVGFTWKTHSPDVAIFAVAVGLASGALAYLTGLANIGIQALGWLELGLLVYSNAFLEEFYFRGVIQSLLERAAGQPRAIWGGGILFGLTHVVFDIQALLASGGALAVLFAVLLQTLAGWLFGIIFMKTRSLWPGMACHYLGNWLPSILAGLSG